MDKPLGQNPAKQAKSARPQSRDDRLKAALKANMARRKEQARARSVVDDNEIDGE